MVVASDRGQVPAGRETKDADARWIQAPILRVEPRQAERPLGILGFSAGGHLAAVASNNHRERSYPAVDDADKVSCRPDFTVLIYPAYLTDKDNNDQVRPEVLVTAGTPPTFIAISQDDPVRVENALGYAAALQKAKVPMELHIYPTGGHGYGLRRTTEDVTTWPARLGDWMKSRKLLERK